jgi:hypothetical protein
MKYSIAALLISTVSPLHLRDIFDAYDEESRKEAQNKSDNIDPAALSAEIGGEEIAREVRGATAGVAD